MIILTLYGGMMVGAVEGTLGGTAFFLAGLEHGERKSLSPWGDSRVPAGDPFPP